MSNIDNDVEPRVKCALCPNWLPYSWLNPIGMSEAEVLVCRKCLKKMGDEFLAEMEQEPVAVVPVPLADRVQSK